MLNSELISFAKSKADHKDPYDYIADVLDDPDRYYKSEFTADDKTRLLGQYQKHVDSNKFLKQLFDEYRQVSNPNPDEAEESEDEPPALEDEEYEASDSDSDDPKEQGHPAALNSLFSQMHMNGLFTKKSSEQDMALQALRYQLDKVMLQNNLKESNNSIEVANELVRQFQDA